MAAKTTDFPVKQRQLNEDIKNGTFKQCYLIYGEEAYLRNQNRDKLVKALAGDVNSMNFNRYEGDGTDPAQIIDMAETMPFLSDKRVILVENSGFFKNGCPQLADYLKAPSETTFFIFSEKEVDKRKDMYKILSKTGFEMSCDAQDENTLKTWIASKVRNEGKAISPRALAFMLERVGTDMSNISTELEKLISVYEENFYNAEELEQIDAEIDKFDIETDVFAEAFHGIYYRQKREEERNEIMKKAYPYQIKRKNCAADFNSIRRTILGMRSDSVLCK